MRFSRLTAWVVAATVFLAGTLITGSAAADNSKAKLDNATCESCHDGNKGKLEVPGTRGEQRALYEVKQDKYEKSVHSKMECIACHKEITDSTAPHKKSPDAKKADCEQCHLDLWEQAKQNNKAQEKLRLGIVVENIAAYKKSYHARENKDVPGTANATCNDCHNVHSFDVPPRGTTERKEWHLKVPNICGKCHTDELADWTASVHGKEATEKHNLKSAVCTDCHTTHDVADPGKDAAKLVITTNCGGCHAERLKTYTKTYHGQVNTLGYAYTAKCFDCHGNHSIQPSTDPRSKLYGSNRLKTCQKCHKDATAGFTKFEPHGTPHDLLHYPFIWLTSKIMLLVLASFFAFFWVHSALWFFREYKERMEHKSQPHVKTDELLEGKFKGKHYQRFPLAWRIAHLTLAVSVMIMTVTGMSVLFADTTWAPVIMHLIGGPKVAAVVHRIFAGVLVTIFIVQLIYLAMHMARNRKTFDWFGPRSIIPRRQDFWDFLSMIKWFLGLGPRPVFDRWTYWQKFDYWAPLVIVAFIATSGVMLLFPTVTAAYLPGWVFNLATIFHGEEALLGVLFVFTVHFFNNHYRPDKFPLSVVMFTGSMRLEEFKQQHRVEYNRLVASGELEKYLVDTPSQPMTLGSKILGFALLGFGLLLLVLVLAGIWGGLAGA